MDRTKELTAKIKAAECRMAEIAVLKTHIINYAKTRDIYTAYRKAGYSKKYYDAHESDIIIHKAAKCVRRSAKSARPAKLSSGSA